MTLNMAQMGSDGTIWTIDRATGFAQCCVGNGRWHANKSRQLKSISCVTAMGVWGIDTSGSACALKLTPPVQVDAGDIASVAGPAGPLWTVTNMTRTVAWKDSAGNTGTVPLPDGRLPAQIAATDPAQPGARPLWAVLINMGVHPPIFNNLFWTGSAWQDSGGPGLSCLAIGIDNSVWGYVARQFTGQAQPQNPGLYRFNDQGQWVVAINSPTGGFMRAYTVVAPYDIWAVDPNLKLYHWDGLSWTLQPDSSPSWIERGWDGSTFGLHIENRGTPQPLLRFDGLAQWVPTGLNMVDFVDNSFAIRDGGTMWWSWGEGLQSWSGLSWRTVADGVTFASISGARDALWATDVNNALYYLDGLRSWGRMPGEATQVSVGRGNLVWSIDPHGNAQRWTGSAWEAHGNPGVPLTSIAALTDGTVLATARVQAQGTVPPVTEGQVFAWDGTQWVATGMVADQIAGADMGHLAGITRGADGTRGDLVLGDPKATFLPEDQVANVIFAPPNPVFPGMLIILSWTAYPGAVTYDARINAAAGSIEATLTGTMLTYTLQQGDMFRNMGGWVHAIDHAGNILAQGSASYYCGGGGG
jgi:hypothetical protein